MSPTQPPLLSRRQMLRSASCGFGYLAFAALASQAAQSPGQRANPLAFQSPQFPARAKRVIFLYMTGGPSHVDTFDYKPELQSRGGQPVPESVIKNGQRAKAGDTLLASPWKFQPSGESGLWISTLFPRLSRCADELCLINSMQADSPSHLPAAQQMHTGNTTFVRPSLGAWTLYGLGSENDSLPGFITIGALGRGGGSINRGSAFLPATFQGTPIHNGTIAHLDNGEISRQTQRRQIDTIAALTEQLSQQTGPDPQLDGVMESYELAFRMQSVAPKVLDLSQETKDTLRMYGIGPGRASDRFGRNCLLARRLAEAGVRFIEVGDGGNYDQHTRLREDMEQNAAISDQPIAALLTDLKQRGLLDETLIMWGGEFGRLPANSKPDGRDHNNKGFTVWLAGGGVKGGLRFGETDPFGYQAVQDPVHIHDLHATILHLMGLDHEQLTFRHSGRDFRLTDVAGNVVESILR